MLIHRRLVSDRLSLPRQHCRLRCAARDQLRFSIGRRWSRGPLRWGRHAGYWCAGPLSVGGTGYCSMNGAAEIYPLNDSASPCGWPSLRWTIVYAVSGSINTSDAEHKEIKPEPISDVDLRAVARVKPKLYRFKDAVEKKGEVARWHYGYIAQDWIEAYKAEGLDPGKHGAFCRDLIKIGGEHTITPIHHLMRMMGSSGNINWDCAMTSVSFYRSRHCTAKSPNSNPS
jgi:hypothetical protein